MHLRLLDVALFMLSVFRRAEKDEKSRQRRETETLATARSAAC